MASKKRKVVASKKVVRGVQSESRGAGAGRSKGSARGRAADGHAKKGVSGRPAGKAVSVGKAAVKKRAAKKRATHTLVHPVFGEVKVDPRKGAYWEKALEVSGREVTVDLTVPGAADATMRLLDRSAQFVTRPAEFDALARSYLRRSYDQESDSAVALYMTHHLEQLSAETLRSMFGKAKQSISIDDFLARTILHRVGLSEEYATFDYTIGKEITQYVIAVRFDENGEILGAEMES